MHPVQFARESDDVIYNASLFDDAWTLRDIGAFGTQATFDVLTQGNANRGLRISTERATYPTDQLNGLRVIVRTESPSAATLDVDAGTLIIDVAGESTGLNTVKARVDAVAGLTSAYFGGENGAGRPTRGEGQFSGGTPDRWAWISAHTADNNPGLLRFGAAVPTDDTGSRVVGRSGWGGLVPPGQSVYARRGSSNDVRGSIEVWHMSRGEFVKYAGSGGD